MPDLANARRDFAETLRKSANVKTEALIDAFATVPRERFLGPPPWKIWDPSAISPGALPAGRIPYETHDDPRLLYRDVLVALDADRGINNGQPKLWAMIYDRIDARPGERIVHIGCGVGYYTAILAELVGPHGSVVGLDIDRALLERARASLAGSPNVEIIERDGAQYAEGPADIIIVNAGLTHPLDVWLDALKPNGRMMLPLTADGDRHEAGFGAFFLITRAMHGFRARAICPTGIFHFVGARSPNASDRLKAAWQSADTNLMKIASLRRDMHDEEETCWLHGDGYCVSRRPVD